MLMACMAASAAPQLLGERRFSRLLMLRGCSFSCLVSDFRKLHPPEGSAELSSNDGRHFDLDAPSPDRSISMQRAVRNKHGIWTVPLADGKSTNVHPSQIAGILLHPDRVFPDYKHPSTGPLYKHGELLAIDHGDGSWTAFQHDKTPYKVSKKRLERALRLHPWARRATSRRVSPPRLDGHGLNGH
ncbi:hypothetical protein IE81DRAFT_27020 [Ceraceosorus guamensis]|uniref:Uncharacterized protein n=1 Tax=Ceraceosorus guamensis TaxID=1522189 RepID=A0A316VQ88_9BASI|nr:hypothetical protein IE81DRAFT_27020 [Ceraceosorus guamensis]PWN39414.1 hypothetical protein IE81DRAFT_27020 [Ceraceosorus guamensis]